MKTRSQKKRALKKSYHHGDLPAALVSTAKAVIAERGLEGCTLREVARRIGVSHVAAYRHYPSREALLADLAEHGLRQLGARFRAALSDEPPALAPRLRVLLAEYVKFCWSEPALIAVMFGPRLSRGGKYPGIDAATQESLGIIEETIAAQAPPAALKRQSARDMGIALWTFAHGFGTLSHSKEAFPNARLAVRAFDDLLTPVLAGLFGEQAAAAPRRPART